MGNLLGKLFRVAKTGELAPTDRLRPGRDVLSTEHEGATVLLDLRRQVYLGIDEVGTVIWRELERGASCGEIECMLEEQYDADTEVLRDDMRRFVRDLLSRGLVVSA